MNKTQAQELVNTILDSLRAEGFTETEVRTIEGIATTALLLMATTGAPLTNPLFPQGLKVAARILTEKQKKDTPEARKYQEYDFPADFSGTKH